MTQETENIDKLRVNNQDLTSKKEIAEGFRSHFETCALKLANEVPQSGECEILINQQNEWGLKRISKPELEKIIDSIKPKNSCGFDLLSNRMLKKKRNISLAICY
jgi:hypothetical protein